MKTSRRGLSTAEVDKLTQQGRTNTYIQPDTKSVWQIIAGTLIDLPNLIIFVSVVFLFVYAEVKDAVIISLIVVTNIIVSVYQEVRARDSLKKIQLLSKETVTVVRDGKEQEIDPEDIVLGDLLVIESGKYIYVDGDIIESEALLIDESILTGESDYNAMQVGDTLLSGSFIVAGRGYYTATRVGPESFVNKITSEAKTYVAYLSPLQRHVNVILKALTYLTIAIIAFLLVRNVLLDEYTQVEMANIVVSVISSMVPQGIVLTLTIAFLLGAVRMGRRRIIVQKASTIETLAGIRYLCMDKTGTITENRLKMTDFLPFAPDKRKIPADVLTALYCEHTLEQNKTITAIAEKFAHLGRQVQSAEIHHQLPFTSRTKMSGIDLTYKGNRFQLLLGSLESLTEYMSPEDAAGIAKRELERAHEGKRNLVILFRDTGPVRHPELTDARRPYQPLALISMEDRLRAGARGIIENFTSKGVKPVIISGDHPETLRALTAQLGLSEIKTITSGKELASASANQAEFSHLVRNTDVFARVSPEQKVQIITELQSDGSYVAMVGDGVNDALAIKQANLGVAMGSGAHVTRNIADIILLDDDIAKLADVVTEGRIILINTLRSAQLLISRHAYSIIIIIGALLLGLPFAFYPLGLFLLAFTNGSIPVLAIVLEKPDDTDEPHFLRDLMVFLAAAGIPAGVLTLYLMTITNDYDLRLQQTMVLAFLTFVGVVNYLFTISGSYLIQRIFIPRRIMIIAPLTVLFFVLVMYTPQLQQIFELIPLVSDQWQLVLSLLLIYSGIMPLLGTLFSKAVRR